MDDQVIFDVISQASQPRKKSVIYQRSHLKRDDSQLQPHVGQLSSIWNEQTQGRKSVELLVKQQRLQQQEKLNYSTIDSRNAVKIHHSNKQLQSTLDNFRRAKQALNTINPEAQLPTSENLKHFNTVEKPSQEIIKLPQPVKDEEQPLLQCSLCELKMTEKDQKLSKRIINYAKDQGGERYPKLVSRVNQAMNLKQIAEWKDEPTDRIKELEQMLQEKPLNESLPITCYRCLYEMLMNIEGRQNALRFMNIAQSDLLTTKRSQSQMRVSTAQRNKQRMEGISQGMKDIQLLQGKFHDSYNEEPNDDDYGLSQTKAKLKDMMSRNNSNTGGYHTLYYMNKTKNHKSQTISINRQKRNTSQEPVVERPSPIPRPWRLEFAEKHGRELENSANRKKTLVKLMEAERLKYYTGYRMMRENYELMLEQKLQPQQQFLRQTKSMRSRLSQMNQNKTDSMIEQNAQIAMEAQDIMRKTYHQNQTTHATLFTPEINQKGLKRPIDRTFFRKISSLGAYANASFNAGVYINPPQPNI